MNYVALAALLALVPVAVAQQPVWAQCGGIGWSGGTSCVSGNVCQKYSDYYSQCIPASQATNPPTTSTSTTSTTTTSSPGSTPTASGLHTIAKAAGKLYFGSATDNPELSDAAYVALLSNNKEFGQITPGNSMKWDATEPTRGQFSFSGAEAVVNLAKRNSQLVRGHNCVWYSQLPSWVSNGRFSVADLTSIVTMHCSTLVGHFKGDIYSWDVINEAFNEDGTWRSDVFYNTLGTSFVATALRAARTADPGAKLYINDYNIEGSGPKANAVINLVRQLKADGVPIDGIGLQCHFIVGQVPSTLQQNLQAMTALGVEVALTELDIRMTLPATQQLLNQQKADYQKVVAACNAVRGCIGITIWDYTDKYSWVPSTFSGQGAALPWDQNLQKKPAYDGIVAGF